MTVSGNSNSVDFHGGDPQKTAAILGLAHIPPVRYDFSVNINPLGAPPQIKQCLLSESATVHYPAVSASTSMLSDSLNVPPESICAGNGATELFFRIALHLRPDRAAWLAPGYSGYAEALRAANIQTVCAVDEAKKLGDFQLAFIGSPNNPNGTIFSEFELVSLLKTYPDTIFVIDESFIDFTDCGTDKTLIPGYAPLTQIYQNLIAVRSLTKFFAIAGLRLGIMTAHSSLMKGLNQTALPWSVNGPAQMFLKFIPELTAYAAETRQKTIIWREILIEGLEKLNILVKKSSVNFICCQLPMIGPTAAELQKKLLMCGLLIRNCDQITGMNPYTIRLAVRPPKESEYLLDHLKMVFTGNAHSTAQPVSRHAKSLCIVGTASNSGKSIVAAGFCRLLTQKGFKTAPFKAQNMALNSAVTSDGKEIGRAQATQAKACQIEPSADMNPVLLKPLGDSKSQIVVNGIPYCTCTAREYYAQKETFRIAAFQAYDRLSEKYDYIVIEGAGSPAEINLLEDDFVNLTMADYAEAQVILVADIDRGGVFASIYGTLALIPEPHRKRICGIIINKFRGDPSLLESGLKTIEAMTGIPVLGVLPWIPDLNIEEEDSLGFETRLQNQSIPGILDIAVIRVPHCANYTDFMPLESEHNATVRYVTDPRKLGIPDLLILPGTKNTMNDCLWMRESGMAARIRTAYNHGSYLFGICGGYQMLGHEILDPLHIESDLEIVSGLSFFDAVTEMKPEKILRQREAITLKCPFLPQDTPLTGYEIHHGITTFQTLMDSPFQTDQPEGAVSQCGRIIGTYLHGCFDAPNFRSAFLNGIRQARNIPAVNNAPSPIVDPFDRLADILSTHLNITSMI